jgi:hypothetical protein
MNRQVWYVTEFGPGRIGPDNGLELKLLLAGSKPAALLHDEEAEQARSSGLLVEPVQPGHEVGLDRWFAARTREALERLKHALAEGDCAALGYALGYTRADVAAFRLHRPELLEGEWVQLDEDGRVVASTTICDGQTGPNSDSCRSGT